MADSNSNRRRRILSILLLSAPLPCSSLPISSSWRIGHVKLIRRAVADCASAPRRRRFGFDAVRRSEDLAEENEYDRQDSDDDNDYNLLASDDEDLKPPSAALSISRGGTNNPLAVQSGNRENKKKQSQSKLQSLRAIQHQKRIQFHKAFLRKRRSFQNSLYALNSRIDPSFPPPPYQLFRISNPSIGKTTLTGKLFLLNIACFALQTLNPALTSWGAKRSDLLLSGRQLHRLVTPIFLHGGIGHLMANGYSLKSMGLNVERSFGPGRFLATYFASGIAGNVLSAIKSPHPAVGASGAIFGCVGAYYAFLSRNHAFFGSAAQYQKGALLETIGINLLLGMTNPMIDNWGHIGGFVGGVVASYLIGPKLYAARVPADVDSADGGGFGVGKVVVDRPTLAFRLPEVVEEGWIAVREGARGLGERVSGLLNGGSDAQFFFDESAQSAKSRQEDAYGFVGRDKAATRLPDDVRATPMDGFRQNVSELGAVRSKRIRRLRSMPMPGRSVRPRYGHLYR